MEIVMEDPDAASLLTLFLAAALRERAEELERSAPRGELLVDAGGMAATLSCAPGRIVVREGRCEAPRARLRGSLEALVEIARGRIAGPLLHPPAPGGGKPPPVGAPTRAGP